MDVVPVAVKWQFALLALVDLAIYTNSQERHIGRARKVVKHLNDETSLT